ncbi:2-dehydropantoate 2-reductase [Paramagnetospirillum marisnigri]|uniref:2-dehydropantoate 2-reductase n=1 Tax=Paramagnetospirillum marisnigri TaxID=1285242 RepID=A0A178M445_9PROT|nr:2-dehydropantoate 2-reductase [Paramagnetospirillum marisnigri]OAN43012.1 2-dehydropantoate 2-reductase [Paramagnetospirillum marisnigri]
MRILILGAGGTGGYFGGRLAQAGEDVTFLVRPKRAAKLAETGLVIKSPTGDAAFPVKTVTAESLSGHWDLIVLSCKAYDLAESIAAVAPAVGPDTTVLPILNGLAHYGPLDAAFGRDKVLGGLCHIFSTLGPDGEVVVMNTINRVTFGERDGGTSPRSETIAASFAKAAFTSVHSPELMQEAWEKYTLLATLAGMTCLMRADVGAIMATSEGEAITREVFEECAAIAAAAGHAPRQAARDLALGFVTDPASRQTASMLRDLEAGGRTEGEHIIGDMVDRARASGLAAPTLRLARCHLQAYEARRSR